MTLTVTVSGCDVIARGIPGNDLRQEEANMLLERRKDFARRVLWTDNPDGTGDITLTTHTEDQAIRVAPYLLLALASLYADRGAGGD